MTSVVYIGGLGRSGSTLLERIAGGFDGVCALGEVVHVWERGVRRDELCSCAEPFSRCPFWREVGEVAFGGWQTLDVGRILDLAERVDRTRRIPAALLQPQARAADLLEYAGYFADVYEAAAKIAGARAVVDSSKHPSTAFVLRRHPALDLRVVHLVRDSRGVAYSWTKLLVRPEASEGNAQPIMHQYPPWRAALLWDVDNTAFAALGRSGVPVWRLHYERLLAQPVQAVRELAGFIGLADQQVEQFVSNDSVTVGSAHQIAGNHVRFQTGRLTLRRDDAWRAAMPAGSRRLVSTLTSPLMLRYGYFGRGARDQQT